MDEETKQRLIKAYKEQENLSLLEIELLKNRKIGYKSPPLHTRFKKGNPGGPGRPAYGPLYQALKIALNKRGETFTDEIVDGILERARKGVPADVRLLVLFTERYCR